MSYSKEFYFEEEDAYEGECFFCSSLEKEFRSRAGKVINDEFYKEFFDFEERQVLKRIVSTKEPAHKIARRIGWPIHKIGGLLLRAVAEVRKFHSEQNLKNSDRKRRPSFGCGHTIIGKASDGCLQCNDVELAEITKHDLPHPTILNLHNPEEPDDI